MKPSVYAHIPFCFSKCPYCSFPVVVGNLQHASDYLQALDDEASRYHGSRASTVYIGGGTPSALDDVSLTHLAALLERHFIIEEDEWTFEFNPESITPERSGQVMALGFNRASFGFQSFQQKYLSYLGRRHKPQEGFSAFKVLRQAGFANINIDLMFGFPGQTMAELDADIEAALSLGSEHVSVYGLTVEDRSVFRVRGETISEDVQAGFYARVCAQLQAGGYQQYEVSNFARTGFESRHNLNYWQGGEYFGLGMGAHSHLQGERSWNADTLPRYLELIRRDGHAVTGREKLSPAAKGMEALLFGLRMNGGVNLGQLQDRFGICLDQGRLEEIAHLVRMGFLDEGGGCIKATDKGRLVLDEISARLI